MYSLRIVRVPLILALCLSVSACDDSKVENPDAAMPNGGSGPSGVDLGQCTAEVQAQGFADCEEGFRHRVAKEVCDNQVRTKPIASPECGIEGECCQFDSDCPDASACWTAGTTPSGDEYGVCHLRCDEDSDCSTGEICECGEGAGRCVKSSCESDEDCAEGALCVSSTRDEGCGQTRTYSCQQEIDTCISDHDCDAAGANHETCASNGEKRLCLDQFQSCDS